MIYTQEDRNTYNIQIKNTYTKYTYNIHIIYT